MGIFGKMFEKKNCAICGDEIGLLGNRKLEDGDRLLCFGRLEEMRDLIPQRKKRRTRVRKLPKVPIHEG